MKIGVSFANTLLTKQSPSSAHSIKDDAPIGLTLEFHMVTESIHQFENQQSTFCKGIEKYKVEDNTWKVTLVKWKYLVRYENFFQSLPTPEFSNTSGPCADMCSPWIYPLAAV